MHLVAVPESVLKASCLFAPRSASLRLWLCLFLSLALALILISSRSLACSLSFSHSLILFFPPLPAFRKGAGMSVFTDATPNTHEFRKSHGLGFRGTRSPRPELQARLLVRLGRHAPGLRPMLRARSAALLRHATACISFTF